VLASDVPVYICNRNRLSTTRRLAEWLKSAGTKSITIIDNDSSYEPLLLWYKSWPESVKYVQQMGRNAGPYECWTWAKARQNMPFIFSDSDVLPADCCPKDLVERCLYILNILPASGKIGPGIRLDNIPKENLDSPNYFEGKTLRQWESQFWIRRIPHTPAFRAPIDTTFALYTATTPWRLDWENIRLDSPYLIEHVPWYCTQPISEEEQYYRAHAEKWSHWGSK